MLLAAGRSHPAQRVEPVPAPLCAGHLHAQLVQHLLLRVLMAEVAQVDKRLAHCLVLLLQVRVLDHVAHNVAVLVGRDQHLLRLDHALDHQQPQRLQHVVVQLRPLERAACSRTTRRLERAGRQQTRTGDQKVYKQECCPAARRASDDAPPL